MNISSITTYLPSAEHQEAAFSGMTDFHSAPKNLTPLQEAAVRAQQIEEQEKDAETRNLVWSTECEVAALDGDADGEDDPDYEQQPDGSFLRIANTDIIPLGVRTESGMIEAIAVPGTIGEAVFGGSMESVPTDLSDLVMSSVDFIIIALIYLHRISRMPGQQLLVMKHSRSPFTYQTPHH